MAWTDSAIIDEETFAGPSDEQFIEFDGILERKLDLNTVGSWATMWIVFLMSARLPRKDLYAPTAGGARDWPCYFPITMGIRASSSAYPPYGGVSDYTYTYPDPRQWIGMGSELAGTGYGAIYQSATGEYGWRTAFWRMLYIEDGTQVNYSGGFTTYFNTDTGPSIRRPFAFAIKLDTTTQVGVSVPVTALSTTDFTKQDCKDWLLNYSTSLDFIYNRPAGNSYGPATSSGQDIDQGTNGALDTIFFAGGGSQIKWRCHGIWGRVFPTVV